MYDTDSRRSARQRYLARHKSLKDQRSPWDTLWKEIEEYVYPFRSRYLQDDVNKAPRLNTEIINSEAYLCIRTLQAGIMAGATSPSRPWFSLGTADPDLNKYLPAKRYFAEVEEVLRNMFARSNIYQMFHTQYGVLAAHGTAISFLEEDHRSYLRGYNLPTGQACLATGPDMRVDTIYRSVSMTVLQLVRRFGYDRCSKHTRRAYDRGDYDTWVELLHVVEPRNEAVPGRFGAKGMPWRSVWLEVKADEDDGILHEGGYRNFPVIAPRWETVGEDVYGISPAMGILGDARALQVLEKDKGKLVYKTVEPPMQGPSSLMHRHPSLKPGDFTPVDIGASGLKYEPAQIVDARSLEVLEQLVIAQHVDRIRRGLFYNLWMMAASIDRERVTAREVVEKAEEKNIQLGPMMDRLESEQHNPVIAIGLDVAQRSGLLPEPPPELRGQLVQVEYQSIFAEAAKLMGASAIERSTAFVGTIATIDPSVVDNMDWDRTVREYNDALGAPPALLRDGPEIQQIRQQRAQMQQMQMQAEQMAMAAKSAKDLAGADLSGDNALSQLAGGGA